VFFAAAAAAAAALYEPVISDVPDSARTGGCSDCISRRVFTERLVMFTACTATQRRQWWCTAGV